MADENIIRAHEIVLAIRAMHKACDLEGADPYEFWPRYLAGRLIDLKKLDPNIAENVAKYEGRL